MSIPSLTDYKKPPHRRDDSGELDVFEAARYFSDCNDKDALEDSKKMVIKEDRQHGYLRQGRASLDIPSLKQQHYYTQYNQNYTIAHTNQQQQQLLQQIKEKKKYKQPSSPGGKLTNFLNSLFNQTIITSKKKKQPKSTLSMKDEDENPSGIRRKRRSSMSHLDGKSFNSSTNSGFRTPPPYTINTHTKTYQNVKSFSDYKQVLATLSKYKIHTNGVSNLKGNDKIRGTNLDCMGDKIKVNKNGFVEKSKNYTNNHGNYQEKKRETKKFNEEVDDGEESDESSDLFELKLDYDFGFCSSGLPVYETTHMDNIKRL